MTELKNISKWCKDLDRAKKFKFKFKKKQDDNNFRNNYKREDFIEPPHLPTLLFPTVACLYKEYICNISESGGRLVNFFTCSHAETKFYNIDRQKH